MHRIDGKHKEFGCGKLMPHAVGEDHGLHTTAAHAHHDDAVG